MKTSINHRNGAYQAREAVRLGRRSRSRAACTFEPLESRQLFSVTGFSLVNQSTFPGTPSTVINQPTIFQSTLQSSWNSLIGGSMKINGQTLSQVIAAGIQSAEAKQGLSAYNIYDSFDATPIYNGTLKSTSSGAVLDLTFDAIGNHTTFTSTTNSILGSWADPTFHVTYNLDLSVALSLPSNLATGKVTATANAVVSDVTVSTSNVLVGLLDVFGADIPGKIAAGINGSQTNLSSVVPTGILNTALHSEAAAGYSHAIIGLNSGGNLLLTAQDSTVTLNGRTNNQVNISSGSGGSIVVTNQGQTHTFPAGWVKKIVVNDSGAGTNSVNIPSLPAGIAVQVNDNAINTDNITVGSSSGSLASVAGTVSVSNSSSDTKLTVTDWGDTAASQMTVTSSAVQLNGRNVVTFSRATNDGQTSLTTEGGRKDNLYIDSTSTPLNVLGLGTYVFVGSNTGSLASIGGPVSVSNFGFVDIFDNDDTANRTVDLSGSTSGIFTSATVAFQGLQPIELGYVMGVTVFSGKGDNTYDALSSPERDFFEIEGHTGDKLTGPAASQVDFNA